MRFNANRNDTATLPHQRAARAASLLLAAKVLVLSLPAQAASPIEHVIHISVDGLHAGQLEFLMHSQPQTFPTFWRLANEGSNTFNARTDFFSTVTLPNHATMLTGRPVLPPGEDLTLHHGYTSNGDPAPDWTLHNRGNTNVPYIASVFDVVHDHGLSTALYSTKSKFSLFLQSYNRTEKTEGGRPDTFLADGDQGTDKIDAFVARTQNPSTELVDTLINDMGQTPFNYGFVHLSEPDFDGHSFGWRSPKWNEGIALVDQSIGRILDLVDTHPAWKEKTAVIVTADHGGLGQSHTEIDDANVYTVPFFVWGPGIPAARDLYALNRWTRADPGVGRPDYLAPRQPIRNGDSGNLALSLLDLPSIDGSFINARQDLLVQPPETAVWDGTNSSAGRPGDGAHWQDPGNWSRSGQADVRARPGDRVLFSPATSGVIQLDTPRVVESLEFQSDVILEGDVLTVGTGYVTVAQDRTVRAEAELTSPSGLLKLGPGHLVVNGTAGELFVSDGALSGDAIINGSLDSRAFVSPGDPIGILSVGGDMTLVSPSVLQFDIAGLNPGLDHDVMIVSGLAVFRSKLQLMPLPGYSDPVVPGKSDQLRILSAGRVFGSFATIAYGESELTAVYKDATLFRAHAGDGLFRQLRYESNGLVWENYRAVPGDANGDGRFDTGDFVSVFQVGLYDDGDNDNATWLTGDWNGDLDFDTKDLIVAFQFGAFELQAAGAAHVPEPAGVWLAGLVLFMGCCFERRRARHCLQGPGWGLQCAAISCYAIDVPQNYVDIDPRELRAPTSRPMGADPIKLHR